MKFVYVVLLGLVIFNGLLLAFADFFPNSTEAEHGVDVIDELGSQGNIGDQLFETIISNGLTMSLSLFAIGTTIALFLTKQVGLAIGLGIFISIVGTLWNATSSVIFDLGGKDPILVNMIDIMTIVIGLILVFTIVDIFTGQRSVN